MSWKRTIAIGLGLGVVWGICGAVMVAVVSVVVSQACH